MKPDLTCPIPVAKLTAYIPHRPPMIWVDEVTAYGPTAGACRVEIKEDALYMSSGGLRASSCIEFIAQTYGYSSLCHLLESTGFKASALKRALLASIKSGVILNPDAIKRVSAGHSLNVNISGLRQMGAITSFHGQVYLGQDLLCEADLKVFSD